MQDDRAARLAFHGIVVFFLGLLAGGGYAAAIMNGASDSTLADWRMAHVNGAMNGMVTWLVAASHGLIRLRPPAERLVYFLFVSTSYIDTRALYGRAITGYTGLAPEGPATNIILMLGFSYATFGVLVATPVLALGFWRRQSGRA